MSNNIKGENKNIELKIFIGIVFVLCIAVGVLFGLIGGGFFKETDVLEKSENNEEKNNGAKIKISDLEFVSKQLEKFMIAMGDCGDVAANYFTTKKVVAADISNELALKTVAFAFYEQSGSVSADDFSKKVKEYFGSDYVYQHFTYNNCINHVYNSASNLYEYVETACGCTSAPNTFIKYDVSEAYSQGDLLVLNVRTLFPGSEFKVGEYHKYYSDAARTNQVGLIYSEDIYVEEAQPLDVEENFAAGGNYKVVLKKVTDDMYSFVSSEPVE